jgi:hypothetical protein
VPGADLRRAEGAPAPPTAMKLHWSKKWMEEEKGGGGRRRVENEMKMEVEEEESPPSSLYYVRHCLCRNPIKIKLHLMSWPSKIHVINYLVKKLVRCREEVEE